MLIQCSTVRGLPGEPETALAVVGDTLFVDGIAHDLATVPEGGEAWPAGDAHPFVGAITRENGAIRCTLRVIYGDDAVADQPTEPAHWLIDAGDGPVIVPIVRRSPEDRA